MKKTLIALLGLIASVSFAFAGNADKGFAVLGGYTSTNANAKLFDVKQAAGFHAGIVYQCPLVAGFALQPGLVYNVKKTNLNRTSSDSQNNVQNNTKLDMSAGFLEVPVQIQWGPDLVVFKPYVFVEPFVGYGINTRNKVAFSENDLSQKKSSFRGSGLNQWEYGLSLGGGIKVWRIMVSAKYYWNFGSLYTKGESVSENLNHVQDNVKSAFKGRNFNGFTVSAAILLW